MLCDKFDMDQHRWRRFLVSMARMEQTLDEVALAYEQVPGQFGEFLDDYVQDEAPYRDPVVPGKRPPYSQDTKARVEEMLKRAGQLVELGKDWRAPPTIRGGEIPKPATDLRITPKYSDRLTPPTAWPCGSLEAPVHPRHDQVQRGMPHAILACDELHQLVRALDVDARRC